MPNMNEMEGVVRKELHIFYVLDTSGSMNGAPIAALNDAMRDTVRELRDVTAVSADAAIKIAVMTYNSDIAWITQGNNGLEDVEDFVWPNVSANGMTYLGYALKELNTKLSRNEMMYSATGNKVPVIIFMSDGYPNDAIWDEELQKLQQNKWFHSAIKIAFALGDDADVDALAKVVGDAEAVIKTNDLEAFHKMIRVVSVSASLTASRSRTTTETVSGSTIIHDALQTEEKKDGQATIIDSIIDIDPDIYPELPVDDFDTEQDNWE